jgi:hypothetical protein
MRGANGVEKSIVVRQFWPDVHKAELLYKIANTFRSLATSLFRIRPTFYSRFTFTVNRVLTALIAGSPKVITEGKTKVQAWFYASGLSYTLPGAIDHAESALEAIDHVIATAHQSDHEAMFFLEYVTCRAYVVTAG